MKSLTLITCFLLALFSTSNLLGQCNGCAYFSYADTILCLPNGVLTTDSITSTGGLFSINTTDLIIDPQTGTVTATGTAQPGIYTVSYSAPAICGLVCDRDIIVLEPGQAQFFYQSPTACRYGDPLSVTPTVNNPQPDTFTSAPPGLVMDGGTGTIEVHNSLPGTYNITREIFGPCANSFTSTFTIYQADTAAFLDYPQDEYCQTDSIAVPTLQVDSSGFFFSVAGIVFADSAGTISLPISQADTHEIRYEIVGACPLTLIDTVIILPAVAPDFTFPDSGYCNTDANPVPVPLNPGGSFVAVTALLDTVSWVDPVTGEVYLDSVTSSAAPLTICYTPNAACTSTLCDSLEIEFFVQPVIQQQGNVLLWTPFTGCTTGP